MIRQIQLQQRGSALQLTEVQAPPPKPGPGQVLLRVHAASLNYRDLINQQDVQNTANGLVPLSDASAEVIALGVGVTRWQIGDRVMPGFFPNWKDGKSSAETLSVALGGGQTPGVLSEQIVASEEALVRVPHTLSHAQAATLPCAGLTAWQALVERGQLQAGEVVLVQGTGGVALFALQIAKTLGAKVIVTSSSDDKLAKAKTLGAWATINYKKTPNWSQEALAMTEGKGVDHILELGGPDTYNQSIAAVAHGGHIHQIGVLTGFDMRPSILPLQFKNANVNGICVGSVAQLHRLARFMEQHQLQPVIDKAYGLKDVQIAYADLASAGHFGKLVIQMN